MLIPSRRPTTRDLAAWQNTVDRARAWAMTAVHRKRVAKARDEVLSFTGAGSCYASVSWGKDSVCVAHLAATLVPRVPLVWVRVEPDYNPDCPLVRDAFLARYRVTYDEIEVRREVGPAKAHGTLVAGAAIAAQRYGDRYMSGVRGSESAARSRRVRSGATSRTCTPIGHWLGIDVFGYLVSHDLPIHPAYACTMGGLLDPEQIRVGPIGGARGARPGDGHGRAEWEQRYYGAELLKLSST